MLSTYRHTAGTSQHHPRNLNAGIYTGTRVQARVGESEAKSLGK